MRALLTPEIVPRLGVVLFKPGRELMHLFASGRVLVEREPENMARFPSGRIPNARQPLLEDARLNTFFTDERVIAAAGGMAGLEHWLRQRVTKCQNPDPDYHHAELTTFWHQPGALLVCWHCDNKLRGQTTEELQALALGNVAEWIIDIVQAGLGYNKERSLSLAELCWWAVQSGIADAITEGMAQRALRLPEEPHQSVMRESDIVPALPATSILQSKARIPVEQVKPVLTLKADPESPESFLLRPKRRRWVNEAYTRWVKTQPCEGCRRPADDPHHIVGHGMGGTATKAHDLFVIPLCRECHDELHAGVSAFEQKHGTQLEMLLRFLDRALAIGVIAKA
ncbi:DUF968 domain-containing protein [Kluyvera sp. SCKS090646]|uniref:DUF968 domain-containing protein n=1 Tax=Kluyvera sichuanensis TaxID=2725494 RepID=A0ABR6S1E5_9ENTR|nr:DUF968 domain-containing protein [Kluyvera sichuanensis]MBC1189236.1 DUF968 domain-containing protein [Kluyvera sichuanensis]